jgi:hypothetical protein
MLDPGHGATDWPPSGGLATFCNFLGTDRDRETSRTAGPERGRTLLAERLVSGYEAFLGGRFTREQDRFGHLAEAGQKPRIMLIGCCDSRVSPEVVFDAESGGRFIVRNIANLVPPYANDDLHGASASLEFGVMNFGVEHIVVTEHGTRGLRQGAHLRSRRSRRWSFAAFTGRFHWQMDQPNQYCGGANRAGWRAARRHACS